MIQNEHICVVCGKSPSDRAHLISRAVIPKKDKWNPKYWIYLCRTHHVEQHTIGTITFCKKYFLVDRLLETGFPEWKIKKG